MLVVFFFDEEVTDNVLLQTVNFSQAQKQGFVFAYIDYFSSRSGNKYTKAELQNQANELLKGCRQHFRRQVIRVSNISAVVNPSDKTQFRTRVMHLLDVESPDLFRQEVDVLLDLFPKTSPFFKWWLTKEHILMLFPWAQNDRELFDKLDKTTNPAEAMHNKLYVACGVTAGKKPHFEVIPGCTAIIAFCDYMKDRDTVARSESFISLVL